MVVVAQLVRASDCDSEGRGFEPPRLPQEGKQQKTVLALFLFRQMPPLHSLFFLPGTFINAINKKSFVRAKKQWATSLHRPLVLNTIGDL